MSKDPEHELQRLQGFPRIRCPEKCVKQDRPDIFRRKSMQENVFDG
jgi:hypothetical protein